MRTSMIQLAALAFAFGVTAMPAVERNTDLVDRDNSAIAGANLAVRATNTKKSSKTKTTKSSKATTTKKSSKTTTTAADAEATTDAAATDSGSDDAEAAATDAATTTKKSSSKTKTTSADAEATTDAAATGDADSDSGSSDSTATETSGSTKTASSGASETTTATTTSGSSSGGSSSGGSLPASSGTSVLSAAQTIAAGESFDGGMVMFDRGVSCTGQAEGGDSDAVFQIEAGGSLSNVIIGPNQIEGVHCQGGCKLTNVWWSAVCEDAFTIKNQEATETTTITGGGAFGAEDKVLQHNGAGTMSVSGFTVDTFGKLYRACGNCASSYERHVIMDDITASSGDILAGINSNFGDTATITNSKLTSVKSVCTTFKGVASGSEPSTLTENEANAYCIFGSDVVSS